MAGRPIENKDPKIAFIFDALEKSGVTMSDFARITRISRVTLYRWKTGNAITDQLRLDLAYNTAVRFKKACKHDMLPLVDKLKPVKRVQVLRNIVIQMATK